TDALGGVTSTAYDAASDVTAVTDADHNTTSYAYDALRRQVQLTDPLSHTATMVYNAADAVVSSTDRDGNLRNLSYDGLGRETDETWTVSGTTVNTLTYTYDAASELLTAADQNGAYTFSYDALGRTTATQEPFGLTLTASYDAANNRTLVQDSQ